MKRRTRVFSNFIFISPEIRLLVAFIIICNQIIGLSGETSLGLATEQIELVKNCAEENKSENSNEIEFFADALSGSHLIWEAQQLASFSRRNLSYTITRLSCFPEILTPPPEA